MIECSKNLYNYESINNILNINFKYLIKDINYILNEDNIINKYKKIMNIYENKRKEMTIIYRNTVDKRIFGELFVKNNKGKCYLEINNKKYDICEYYPLNNNEKRENIKIIENTKNKKYE